MGCAGAKIVQHDHDLFNKEYKTKRHLSAGVHVSKSPDGIEASARAGYVGDGFEKFFLLKRATPTPPTPPP
mgnify:CR=1 FL=1